MLFVILAYCCKFSKAGFPTFLSHPKKSFWKKITFIYKQKLYITTWPTSCRDIFKISKPAKLPQHCWSNKENPRSTFLKCRWQTCSLKSWLKVIDAPTQVHLSVLEGINCRSQNLMFSSLDVWCERKHTLPKVLFTTQNVGV